MTLLIYAKHTFWCKNEGVLYLNVFTWSTMPYTCLEFLEIAFERYFMIKKSHHIVTKNISGISFNCGKTKTVDTKSNQSSVAVTDTNVQAAAVGAFPN